MALQGSRTALVPPKRLLSLDTLTFLRAASTATLAGTYPYNIPKSFTPPPYPYGPSTHYRRRDSGLYGGTSIQHGNLISDKYERKSRRVWRPNVHNKKLWSNYLGRFVQVKVVARVLRTIDKVGGLDEYLVGNDSPARIKELGVVGWGLRWRVMQTQGYQDRVAAERRALGLPEKGWIVEEAERKKVVRKEGARIAEAYLEALKSEVDGGSSAPAENSKHVMGGEAVNFMEEMDTAAAEEENAERQFDEDRNPYAAETEEKDGGLETTIKGPEKSQERPGSGSGIVQEQDAFEEYVQDGIAPSIGTSVDSAMPETALGSPSEQLFTQLAAIAAQLHTTPGFVIDETRAMIENRTVQVADAADRKAEVETERAALVSEIDNLLASSDVDAILSFHTEQLAIARSENALQRERKGKPPLSQQKIKLNVTGPPSAIPADKWARFHAYVKPLRAEESKRQQELAEAPAHRAERRRYLQEHREEIWAEQEKRRKSLGIFRRLRFDLRWIRRSGLKARFKKYREIRKAKAAARKEELPS